MAISDLSDSEELSIDINLLPTDQEYVARRVVYDSVYLLRTACDVNPNIDVKACRAEIRTDTVFVETVRWISEVLKTKSYIGDERLVFEREECKNTYHFDCRYAQHGNTELGFWKYWGYDKNARSRMKNCTDIFEKLDKFAEEHGMRWNILPNSQTTCKALREGRGSLGLYKVEDIPWIWRIIQRHPEESKTAVAKAVKNAANILKMERYRRSFV
jgi:hypothetical protein